MKTTANTLDNMVIKRPSDKQNLCLDKGYDFSEIEREVIKRGYITHISVTQQTRKYWCWQTLQAENQRKIPDASRIL